MSKHGKLTAKLQHTFSYEMFDLHENNRTTHDDPILLDSMREHGFMPSSPIHVVKAGEKLKIIRGHHRFRYAKALGLPIWYVVDDSNLDIHNLEGSTRVSWSVSDFAASRAKDGDSACVRMLAFQRKHGLTLGSAASLVGGQSAGSNNMNKAIREGKFAVGDMIHANAVVEITDTFRSLGLPYATSSAFVAAVSCCVRTPKFSSAVLLHKIQLNPGVMTKRSTIADWLCELEGLYNYGARSGKLPLAFEAKKIATRRSRGLGLK